MVALQEIARLADVVDNCAIAIKTVEAGTEIEYQGRTFKLSHTVLVGHRFAIRSIPAGHHLLSWKMPFGTANQPIKPGDYVCNEDVLTELRQHRLDFELPDSANFKDKIPSFHLSKDTFTTTRPIARLADGPTFAGYQRPGGRGVGTRNHIVLLAVNGTVAGFTKQLAAKLQDQVSSYANIDSIVAAVHTEGIKADSNNRELLLRSLAGYIVHPNTGAVLIIDNGRVGLTNEMVQTFMVERGYALDQVKHQFFSVDGPFAARQAEGMALVGSWCAGLNKMQRQETPVSELKIALQCGGSDAFSGISGNPLIAWVARKLISYGGAANLAETDELQGAEAYILRNVRDRETAERFIETVERFKAWAAKHGHSAEGNPSGGNRYRGLYNIYLKSLGAAAKRHPDVPLDHVIDYSVPMNEPGFYFMDSPGNDLESIAGQVGSGCNLIFFVTGNGSITNFPFVPTLKVVTTSERYTLLENDMDIDSGSYLNGTPMDELGEATWEHFLRCASGQLTVGEKAGHAQLQIWREWLLGAGEELGSLPDRPVPTGQPIPIHNDHPAIQLPPTSSQPIGLILPTSLCSGQIARMAVEMLNRQSDSPFSRFATLVHTEGCGVTTQAEFIDTLLGYMVHPSVGACLLLEHGCEKTHNSYWRQKMLAAGIDLTKYGWASIQQDGGIEKSMAKLREWFFTQELTPSAADQPVRVGLLADDDIQPEVAQALAQFVAGVVSAGGSVIVPERQSILQNELFCQTLGVHELQPSLSYAQWRYQPGFHVMADPSNSWTEMLTGLGATGVEVMVSLAERPAFNGHPLVPLVQIGSEGEAAGEWDLILSGPSTLWPAQISQLVAATRNLQHAPVVQRQNNVDFQITRGLLGISL